MKPFSAGLAIAAVGSTERLDVRGSVVFGAPGPGKELMMARAIGAAGVILVGIVAIGAESALAQADDVPVMRTLEHGNQVLGVAFSPDGAKLASTGCCSIPGAQVKVWSSRTGGLLHALDGDKGGWRSVAFSPDGSSLAGGGYVSTLQVWDAETGKTLWATKFEDPPTEIFSVAYARNGNLLAAGGRSSIFGGGFNPKIGVVRVYDAREGRLLQRLDDLDDVWAVAFPPDGRTLAVGTNSGNKVVLFDTTNWKPVRELVTGRVSALAYSPDGRLLAVSCLFDGMVRLFRTETGAVWKEIAGPNQESVLSVAFSPDGQSLATGSYDMTARVFDVETGVQKCTLKTAGWANSVAFSPDGALLAVGERASSSLWNWRTGIAP